MVIGVLFNKTYDVGIKSFILLVYEKFSIKYLIFFINTVHKLE